MCANKQFLGLPVGLGSRILSMIIPNNLDISLDNPSNYRFKLKNSIEFANYRSLYVTSKEFRACVVAYIWENVIVSLHLCGQIHVSNAGYSVDTGAAWFIGCVSKALSPPVSTKIRHVKLHLSPGLQNLWDPTAFYDNVITKLALIRSVVLQTSDGLISHCFKDPNRLVTMLSSFPESCGFRLDYERPFMRSSRMVTDWDANAGTSDQFACAFEHVARVLVSRDSTKTQTTFGLPASPKSGGPALHDPISQQDFVEAIKRYLRLKGADTTLKWMENCERWAARLESARTKRRIGYSHGYVPRN